MVGLSRPKYCFYGWFGRQVPCNRIFCSPLKVANHPQEALAAFPIIGTACAALVVEVDDPLGGARQVGDDEPDAGIKLARMPLSQLRLLLGRQATISYGRPILTSKPK
jgi:hypothetical protein